MLINAFLVKFKLEILLCEVTNLDLKVFEYLDIFALLKQIYNHV